MNWDFWLPWRKDEQKNTEDSSYEDEVIIRCDHDFEQTTELLPGISFTEATFEEGYIVVPQYEEVEEFCMKCGEPGMDGEVNPYGDYDYTASYDGIWTRVARKLAFQPTFEIDSDLSVSDAITEPVKPSDDCNVDDDDGSGRVLVNQHEDMDFGVTD